MKMGWVHQTECENLETFGAGAGHRDFVVESHFECLGENQVGKTETFEVAEVG